MIEELKILHDYLQRKGLKNTSQREIVLKVFLNSPKHLSVDDLARQVQEKDSKIGYSTVYRTLKLFAECGLARESQFMHGRTIFEPAIGAEDHDHLVSMDSEQIEEFHHELINAVQDKVCRARSFKADFRRLEIYGEFNNKEAAAPLEGKAEVFRRLNDSLEREMTMVSRYLHQSLLLTGPGSQEMVKNFRENVEESTEHATLLGEMIVAEGGEPVVKILEIFKPEGMSPAQMMKNNLGYEREARDTYKALLPFCKPWPNIEQLISRLVKEETVHAAEMESLIKTMEDAGNV